MGQRMQIYMKVEKRTIGVHCQWLYGKSALEKLEVFLEEVEFNKTTNKLKKYNASHANHRLREIFCNETLLDTVVADPRTAQDNDNGILVIDLTEDSPRYSFLSLWGLQCEQEPNLTVQHPDDPFTGQDYSYTNYTPITAKEWIQLHYGDKELDKAKTFEDVDVLTSKDLGEIFPDMIEEKKGAGIIVQANTLLFMDVVEKKFAVRSTTKTNTRIGKRKAS